jgi:hypothetical protein
MDQDSVNGGYNMLLAASLVFLGPLITLKAGCLIETSCTHVQTKSQGRTRL